MTDEQRQHGGGSVARQDDLIRESVIRDMPEGVAVIGLDGAIQTVNRAAERIEQTWRGKRCEGIDT